MLFRCTFCGLALAARWLSSLPGSQGQGRRPDLLLWVTTALTRILYWHQPFQNNTHVRPCFPWLVPPGAKLHVPLALPGSRFHCCDPLTLLVCEPLRWGGTRWFLTGCLDIWKPGGRAQLRRPRGEPLFGYFSSGFLQKQAKWDLSWRKSC